MKKFFKWLLIIFLILLSIIIYARYFGTSGLITKEYSITSSSIPTGFDGSKIVHFSDLHYNRILDINKVKKIVDEINLINPDIVVFTGDLIDQDVILTKDDYQELATTLSKINTKYGKYAILGNHDYTNDKSEIISVYNNSDFIYLDNSYDIIYNKKGEKIFIGGINSVTRNEDNLEKTMSYFKDNDDISYKIIIVHEPDIADEIVKNYNVNLILAGHSHNGQVRLPLIGPLYTPKYAKKYYDNYYKIGDTDLYISSGIGVSIANYRLWNRPSINFYRLNSN